MGEETEKGERERQKRDDKLENAAEETFQIKRSEEDLTHHKRGGTRYKVSKNQRKKKEKADPPRTLFPPRTQPNPRAFRTHTIHQASWVSRKLNISTKRHGSNREHGEHEDEKINELTGQKKTQQKMERREEGRKTDEQMDGRE